MNVLSIEHALADSAVVADVAKRTGITLAQARAFCAALSEVPIRQAIRICATARADRIRQINRDGRKGR